MAAAERSISSGCELSNQPCNCYRVLSLTETILNTDKISSLRERYILGEQLGWGQFGVIRVCTDKFTGEVLACKSISKDRLRTSDDAKSVKLEIEIMTRLSANPNVVDLKAVYEDEDSVHLVMELCAGGELFHQLEKRGRFSESDARVIFRHLMQVVSYCHEIGVVHRDLKPENILLATKSSSSPIKLADFGLATYIKAGQSLHGTVGSPFYIAPEVLSGGYNQAADIWSAGVILYILLSATPPFWGKTKSQIFDAVRAADLQFPLHPWDHISGSVKELVREMLCTDPSQRLTAQQVLAHPWMKDDESVVEEPSRSEKKSCQEWVLGGISFSMAMTRNLDISFGTNSSISGDVEPSCRPSISSFSGQPYASSFLCSEFSFRSIGDSNALELSAPMTSMPSFTFISPSPVTDTPSNSSMAGAVRDEPVLESVVLPDTSLCCGHEAREMERRASEVKRSVGAIESRILGLHSKRNRTIGLGEREQLGLMVTESVIRWASCTNLPTGSSLRSSLVC